MKTAVLQFLLCLSDLDMPLKVWIFRFHGCLSLRVESMCLRIKSLRLGLPFMSTGGAACARGAAAFSAPEIELAARLVLFFVFIGFLRVFAQ